MSNDPVVIEVTRGPVVESRHEGIAAVVKPDGTVVASWGDIDARVLPRSANKPIQAMAFVESGAVEQFGLGDEHIALACASHNGEPRHVETVTPWSRKVGLGEADLECGTHPPRLPASIEALVREGAAPTAAFNNCSGKHSGFLTTAVQYGEPTKGYIKYDHPVQRRLREVMTDLCGSNADDFAYGTDGCGIPTLATPLKSLARAMASMAEPSRLSNKHAEAATRIRAAMNAEPFMMAGTGRFCTRINAALPGVGSGQDRCGGRVLRHAADPGPRVSRSRCGTARARAAEVAMATLARSSRRIAGRPRRKSCCTRRSRMWSACWSARCGRPRAGWGSSGRARHARHPRGRRARRRHRRRGRPALLRAVYVARRDRRG